MRKNKQALIAQNLTPKELLLSAYLSQGIILILAIIFSFFIFDWNDFVSMLNFDWKWVILAAFSGVAIVIFDIVLMKLLPKHFFDDGGINKKLFANQSVGSIFCLALVVAIAEEWLFRGVIQSKFGLIFATLVFAFIHIRYWSHWFLLIGVVLISFLIALIYQLSGNQLIPVIVMHFTIDFLLGLYIRKKR